MELSYFVVNLILILALIGFQIGLWRIFQKAGVKAWLSLIPIYNMWVWLRKVLERPWWWMIFIIFPFIGVFMFYMMVWKTIRQFGKTSYLPLILGTFFFFFYLPYLGFAKKETFIPYSELPVFKKSSAREWGDAIIFAVAAAYIIRMFLIEFYAIPTSSMESSLMVGDYLAVSKVNYGPRVPQTPLAFPFVHHTMPMTKTVKAYVEWLTLPYMRFSATSTLKHNDVVVFNYPDGDTVIVERQSESYYAVVREFEAIFNPNMPNAERERVFVRYAPDMIQYLLNKYPGTYYSGKGREVVWKEYNVISRPVDKRENYVKRCVALAGDTLQIKDTQLYINGKPAVNPDRMQFAYFVIDSTGIGLTPKKRQMLDINEGDMQKVDQVTSCYCLNKFQCAEIEKMNKKVIRLTDEAGAYDGAIFPHDVRYAWNKDNFGPIVLPKKGSTVEINDSTIVLYDKIIRNYELNELEVRDGKVFINGKEAHSYTFKQNYYFMMGDNRHNSADSRFWGFVPEDHIVGKPVFVWLSLDKYKTLGEGKIRWKRMFKTIKNK